MKELLEQIANCLFHARDSVCLDRANLVTEAYGRFGGLPPPMLRAKTFEHVLLNMQLDVTSNPVFAGNTSSAPRAWMLCPEFGFLRDAQVEIEHPDLRDFLNARIPDDMLSFWKGRQFGGSAGVGHMSLDFNLVVNHGLLHVLTSLRVPRAGISPEQAVYREAMAVCVRAVIGWAERYACEAREAAHRAKNPLVAACLRRVAAACLHVPARPARDLFEGLQAMALVHLASVIEGQGMSMSIGLPDRILARFCTEAAQNPEQAIAFVRAFLLKIASNSFLGHGSKTQAITIGGATSRGDACNALTQTFLDAFDATPVNDPHLFLRWHSDRDGTSWRRAMSMLSRGRSMPMLVNDHQVVPGLLAAGVTEEDAWDYCIVGCNELGIPGRCCQSGNSMAMGFNDLELLDGIIRSEDIGPDRLTAAILDAYEREVARRGESGLRARQERAEHYARQRPFPFCSACCMSCVESGQDITVGMPYPHIYGMFIRGTANAVNALAAIESLVVEKRRYRLDELLAGLDAARPDVMRSLAEAPKWGNDEEMPDRLAIALNMCRNRALRGAARKANVPPIAVCHVVRSLHFVDGKRIGATLDGRMAHSPVGDSIGPVVGTAAAGPTATLNSVLKLDAARWFTGIYNLNITLPAGPQADPSVVQALSEAFFIDGGQELQVNVLDVEMLRDAQRNPRDYEGLVVRVAGLNARFVELSLTEQEELIVRAEMAAG